VTVHHYRVDELARALLWAWKTLTYGFPRTMQPKIGA
jgi:hypothetical protein